MSLWQRAPYHSLANKTINSNVQTEKEILNIWISSLCITCTCSPYALCTFQNQLSAKLHPCFLPCMQGGWDAAGTSWYERGSDQEKGEILSSWGQQRNRLTSQLALLWAEGWTRDLLGSLSDWIMFCLECIQPISQRHPLFHKLCVTGSPCEDQQGFWPSPNSPGPAWEMIAKRYGTRNSQQHFVRNLQLQTTLIHPQGSTFKVTDFHDTSRKMCMSNTCGLNYVLELPSFLLNKYKKVKGYFRESQPHLMGYLKHQTQVIAKGNSVLGILDLSSQAVSTTSLRQCPHQAVTDCCQSRQEIMWEVVKYTNTGLMTLAGSCTDSLWGRKHPRKWF